MGTRVLAPLTATLLALLASGSPARADAEAPVPAKARPRVLAAEQLEAEARARLDEGDLDGAEAKALEAVDTKRRALKRDALHPRMATAYLVLADVQFARLGQKGGSASRIAQARAVPTRREPALQLLYRRVADLTAAHHGAVHPRRVVACLVLSALNERLILYEDRIQWAARGLAALGPSDGALEPSWLARGVELAAGTGSSFTQEMALMRSRGLTKLRWSLVPYGRRHLANVLAARGPDAIEAARAQQRLAHLLFAHPKHEAEVETLLESAYATCTKRGLRAGDKTRRDVALSMAAHLTEVGKDADAERRLVPELGTDRRTGLGLVLTRIMYAKELGEIRAKAKDPDAGLLEVTRETIARHGRGAWRAAPSYVARRLADELVATRSKQRRKAPGAYAEAVTLRALVDLELGLFTEAREALERVPALLKKKDLLPQRIATLRTIGYAACLEKRLDLAEKALAEALKLEKGPKAPATYADFQARVNLADVLARREKFEGAHALLDAAMAGFRQHEELRAAYPPYYCAFPPVFALLRRLGREQDALALARGIPELPYISAYMPGDAERQDGRLREALALQRAHALDMEDKIKGVTSTRNPDWAEAHIRLAGRLLDLGAEDEAIAEFLDVVGAFEAADRSDYARIMPSHTSPNRAMLLGYEALALAHMRRGEHDAASVAAEQAFEVHAAYDRISERRYAPPFHWAPYELTLGFVLDNALAREVPLESRAPEIHARALVTKGEPEQALRILERSIAATAKRTGTDHPRLALALHTQARIELELDRRVEALAHGSRALTILEKRLGKSHPEVADVLVTLGEVALRAGQPAQARTQFQRAIQIARRELYDTHLLFPLALTGIALAHVEEGTPKDAVEPMQEALERIAARMEKHLVGATNKQRVAMLASVEWALAAWTRIAEAADVVGYAEVLALKGRVGRALALDTRLMRRADGKAKALAEDLDATRRRLATLAYRAPRYGWRRAAWRRKVAEASKAVEKAEAAFLRASGDYRRALERAAPSPDAIEARLTSDTVLIDVLLAGGRYLAWTLDRGKEPVRRLLGDAADLDPLLEAFRDGTREAESRTDARYLETGRALAKVLWAELEALLPEGTKRIHLVLDGPLAATPLEALPLPGGKTLIDTYEIVRLGSAQDLLPPPHTPKRGRGLLAIGDVDFDHVVPDENAPAITGKRKTLAERVPGLPHFSALPASAREVGRVAEHYTKAGGREKPIVLLRDEPTEKRVREAVAGRLLLHFATHGFLRENLDARLRVPKDKALKLRAGLESHVQRFDPFLMSGLALTGVNKRATEGDHDGLLTALEVLAFDLDGVELAFLSACETARGIEQSGEGLLGLVRAFQLAGARQVVASLWPVSDDATFELVDRFYAAYLGKKMNVTDAMKTAVQALREHAKHGEPRHWAAFCVYGTSSR